MEEGQEEEGEEERNKLDRHQLTNGPMSRTACKPDLN
jgi:hypothetical protein